MEKHQVKSEITEQTREINGHGLFDFGKEAFAQLEVELPDDSGKFVELLIGEVAENGKIVHEPGWRTFQIDRFVNTPETRCYRFRIPEHIPGYSNCPHMKTPVECGGEVAPFRYVEINHYYGKATVRRIAWFGQWDDTACAFESSDPQLNRIWDFCKYSVKATTLFPCYIDGDRERMPYEGDAYINQLSHFCCDANYDLAERTIDHFFANGAFTWPTEWLLLTPILVRDYVLYSGNREPLNRWLPLLPEKLLPALAGADGLIRGNGKIRDIVDWPLVDRDGYEFGDVNFVPNAYYCGALEAMSELTGNKDYADCAAAVRRTLRKLMLKHEFFTDHPDSGHTSLHTAMFALYFNIAEEREIPHLQQLIRSRKMACSVYGAQFLLETCFRYGMDDHALELMTSNGLRSWCNMLEKGATITTEGWDETIKPFQDWTHPWASAPANIIPRYLCGLRPLAPGWRQFELAPSVCAPASFYLKQATPLGTIELTREHEKNHIELTPSGRKAKQTLSHSSGTDSGIFYFP